MLFQLQFLHCQANKFAILGAVSTFARFRIPCTIIDHPVGCSLHPFPKYAVRDKGFGKLHPEMSLRVASTSNFSNKNLNQRIVGRVPVLKLF